MAFPPSGFLVKCGSQFANIPSRMRTEFLWLRQFVLTKARPDCRGFAAEERCDDDYVHVCCIRQLVKFRQILAWHQLYPPSSVVFLGEADSAGFLTVLRGGKVSRFQALTNGWYGGSLYERLNTRRFCPVVSGVECERPFVAVQAAST